MIEISIIIPVYNGEIYIRECIKSVQNQSMQNFEIICVDDGSTDLSYTILEELREQDKRIKILRQKNKGAGAARNLGIREASGEYIAFLDADDYYVDSNALQVMIQRCKDFDVDVCGSTMSQLINGIEKKAYNSNIISEMEKQDILEYSLFQFDYDFTTYIYKRMLIVENNIEFPNYRIYEDPPFLVKVLYAAKKFTMVDINLYCYRLTPGINKLTKEKTSDLLLGLMDNLRFSILNNFQLLFDKTVTRINYEYCDLICNNITLDSINNLELLLQMNNLIWERQKKDIIRPLRKIINLFSLAKNDYEKYLLNKIYQRDSVYIYGAGINAKNFLRYMEEKGLHRKVKGVLVTDKKECMNQICGIDIMNFSEIKLQQENALICIAVSSFFVAEIVHTLEMEKIYWYEILDTVFLETIF